MKSANPSTTTAVALLRGVNVGGKHVLPMKELVHLFEQAGCSNVRTFIQSGNVIFSAPPNALKELPRRVGDSIEKRFGFTCPVILRSLQELDRVVRSNPFLRDGVAATTLHVYFLADTPNPAAVRTLDPQRSPLDSYHVKGKEIYLHLPNGMGRSKLTSAYFDSKLSTVCTARNWATVTKLLELIEAA